MGDVKGPRRMTRRLRAMLEAYGAEGEGRFNATEAARKAGYRWPERTGWRLKRRHAEAFAEVEQKFRQALKVQREEVEERISALARNPAHRDHFKALELCARMHGLLSEKINVTIDRADINSRLDELIQSMMLSRAQQKSLGIEPAEVALLASDTATQNEK